MQAMLLSGCSAFYGSVAFAFDVFVGGPESAVVVSEVAVGGRCRGGRSPLGIVKMVSDYVSCPRLTRCATDSMGSNRRYRWTYQTG